MKRKIIEVDQSRCDGCGLCIPNCAEGALKIVDGKARLVGDSFCDGLGACLGQCPKGAIRMVEREADEFDLTAVNRHHGKQDQLETQHSCPGSRFLATKPSAGTRNQKHGDSQLTHWPIQLHLAPLEAPFFKDAELLVAASCVPFAYADFHRDLLAGKSLIIACPKLDRTEPYLEKLTEIIRRNDIRSLTVAVMEVPCCQGLVRLAQQALGKRISITVEVIGVDGERK